MAADARSTSSIPAVWGQVPQRNRNFTGRLLLLDQLRKQLSRERAAAVLPHALQGLGGVGKTQLAIEYIYRASEDYQVVWWISADQPTLIPSQLAALAPRLGLTGLVGRQEEAVDAVLDALRRGEPYSRWLLIFDNADQPEQLTEYFPAGQPNGHILVTSRNHRWKGPAETVVIDVFDREESLEFLHRRVEGVIDDEANTLSEELGDLPLALEQAGALLAETGMSIPEYIDLLQAQSRNILAENPPSDYKISVAAAWSLSMSQLRAQTPAALEFLHRCAFFGPEPIPRDLFINGAQVFDAPLRDQLGDPIQVSRAMRELGRYALARIDNNRRTIQVHRLIQKLVRDALTPDEAARMTHEVHELLIFADPRDPDDRENWQRYESFLPHLGPSGIVRSTNPRARRFVWNVVAFLYNIGDYGAATAIIDEATENWRRDSGEDDRDVLLIAGLHANVLFGLGDYDRAYQIRKPTLDRMREALGENDEFTLNCLNGYGADLRARGEFAEALSRDEESLKRHREVFGSDQRETFRVLNSLAVDYELNGRYADALDYQNQNYREEVNFFGRDDDHEVVFTLSAISRVQRHLGRYTDALESAERANQLYAEVVRRGILPEDHPWILIQARDLSIVQRLAGDVAHAVEGAQSAFDRYAKSRLGGSHPDALAAGINRGNALRLAGSLSLRDSGIEEGVKVLEETVSNYGNVWTPRHPFFHIGNICLAVGRLVQKQYEIAAGLLSDARAGLMATVGPNHHYTLVSATNLATAHAELGDVEMARTLGQETLPLLAAALGTEHPHTLACALNLRLDERALGNAEAERRLADELNRFEAAVGADHYDVSTVRAGGRVSSVIEPPPV